MPALKNPKHEQFCQAYMHGKNAGNASACYAKIYGKSPATPQKGYKLISKAHIVTRLAELQAAVTEIQAEATERAIEELGISKQKVMEELARMGFANILDYVVPQPNGTVRVDLSALERDKAAAIQEVTVDAIEVDGEAKAFRVRFKLADKRAALVDLSKLAGFHVNEPTLNLHAHVAFVDKPPHMGARPV